MRILYLSSEAHPLVKTGGLGDVAGALPAALNALGEDTRLMLPAYPKAMDLAEAKGKSISLGSPIAGMTASLIPARMPGTGVPLILVDSPPTFGRPGNPYTDKVGNEWPDNHLRFALFSKVALMVGKALGWKPDIIQGNDWQCGLVSAYLHFTKGKKPASVFSIHNIEYPGLFPARLVRPLGLPPESFAMEGLEYHGFLSYLKAGLYYSDAITTVSPTYAREIQTVSGGMGFGGLLSHRSGVLQGILNGADYETWDPATGYAIPHAYSAKDMSGKALDKTALQEEMGLLPDANAPLIGVVSRLTPQKGLDLVLPILDKILDAGAQLVVLGTGDKPIEDAFSATAKAHPHKVAVHIGYDEDQAHRIQGGADIFLMPSRREPCGLTQLYALRHGTLPVVRNTGGLADTVIDMATPAKGTGFLFEEANSPALLSALRRAFALYGNRRSWGAAQKRAMKQDFSWQKAAKAYCALYRTLA